MTRRDLWGVAILAWMALSFAGCASTQPYAKFAQAGTVYVTAADKLLLAAGNVSIDATSERLLQDDAMQNLDADQYRQLSQVDVERLEIFGRLRTHIRLLGRYFLLLNQLATSEAPDRIEKQIGEVADGLNSLGKQLRESPLITNEKEVTAITGLTMGFAIRGRLKEELNRRKDTIQVEIKTQEEMLRALGRTLQHDLTIINQAREQRWVIVPLISPAPIANPDAWIDRRRTILTSSLRLTELDTAADAARTLRESFENLVGGKLSVESVDTMLTDMEGILAVAESIHSQPGGKK